MLLACLPACLKINLIERPVALARRAQLLPSSLPMILSIDSEHEAWSHMLTELQQSNSLSSGSFIRQFINEMNIRHAAQPKAKSTYYEHYIKPLKLHGCAKVESLNVVSIQKDKFDSKYFIFR